MKDLYGNNDHTSPIVYLLKYGFQAYLPNLEIKNRGRMYYISNGIETFMKQYLYEYGAILFITYIIFCVFVFPGKQCGDTPSVTVDGV